MLKYFLILQLFAISSLSLTGQNNCEFQIDTQSIFLNQNLDTFIHKLESDTFHIIPDIRMFPQRVQSQLQCLLNGFGIANPNQDFRCCCTSPDNLPQRQLTQLGISKEILVMTYRKGEGIVCNSRLLIIRFGDSGIIDLWTDYYSDKRFSIKNIANYLRENKLKYRSLKTDFLNF